MRTLKKALVVAAIAGSVTTFTARANAASVAEIEACYAFCSDNYDYNSTTYRYCYDGCARKYGPPPVF